MIAALSTILGLRHTLPTGIAIAALLLAFGPQIQKLNGMGQTKQVQALPAQAQQEAQQELQEAQHEVQQQLPQPPKQVQELENSLHENLKVLELNEDGFNWKKDWWKYTIMALSIVLIAYLILTVTNMLFRTAIVTLCISFGLIGSLLISPFVTPVLEQLLRDRLPAFLEPVYISYGLCFLICYLLITSLTNMIIKPGRKRNNAKAE